MTITGRFNTFCENIRLTTNQFDDAKTKYDNVCRALHNYYYPTTTYNGSSKFLIGSYGKETAIRPPGDVDVIFRIPYTTYERFSKNKTGPRGLLNEIKTVLTKSFTTTEKIRPNGMVVEVAFATFNIEVLPAYEWTVINKGQFVVPDTSKGYADLPALFDFGISNNYGRWKDIDPRKEINELSSSNTLYNGNTKQLIRMMKRWRTFCNVPLKGVIIERLAIDFIWAFAHRDATTKTYYDFMIRDFLYFLINRANTTIFMPGINEDIQIGNAWKSKAETAYQIALTACKYELERKDFDAAYEWKKLFGNDYPY